MGRQINDLTGQSFGKLFVLRRGGNYVTKPNLKRPKGKKYILWHCKCECGKEVEITSHHLRRRKGAVGCGCLRRLPRFAAAKNHLYSMYKRSSAFRGLDFTLSFEEVIAICSQICSYCGAQPAQKHNAKYNGEFLYNGIDRMDNSRGYVQGNCVPCCGCCNYMKSNINKPEFLAQIERIHERQIQLIERAA